LACIGGDLHLAVTKAYAPNGCPLSDNPLNQLFCDSLTNGPSGLFFLLVFSPLTIENDHKFWP
ncbi:MAG: hypothetical protein ACXVKO_06815, partial [Bacteriovorax sp.]